MASEQPREPFDCTDPPGAYTPSHARSPRSADARALPRRPDDDRNDAAGMVQRPALPQLFQRLDGWVDSQWIPVRLLGVALAAGHSVRDGAPDAPAEDLACGDRPCTLQHRWPGHLRVGAVLHRAGAAHVRAAHADHLRRYWG